MWMPLTVFRARVTDWVDNQTKILAEDVENWQGRIEELINRLNELGHHVDSVQDDTTGEALAGYVPKTRIISTGPGMQGGGALGEDLALQVAFGNTAETAAVGNDARITGAVQSSNLTELVQDVLGSSLAGSGISVQYDDASGITTLSLTGSPIGPWQASSAGAWVQLNNQYFGYQGVTVRSEGATIRVMGGLWLSGSSRTYATSDTILVLPPGCRPAHTALIWASPVSGTGDSATVLGPPVAMRAASTGEVKFLRQIVTSASSTSHYVFFTEFPV